MADDERPLSKNVRTSLVDSGWEGGSDDALPTFIDEPTAGAATYAFISSDDEATRVAPADSGDEATAHGGDERTKLATPGARAPLPPSVPDDEATFASVPDDLPPPPPKRESHEPVKVRPQPVTFRDAEDSLFRPHHLPPPDRRHEKESWRPAPVGVERAHPPPPSFPAAPAVAPPPPRRPPPPSVRPPPPSRRPPPPSQRPPAPERPAPANQRALPPPTGAGSLAALAREHATDSSPVVSPRATNEPTAGLDSAALALGGGAMPPPPPLAPSNAGVAPPPPPTGELPTPALAPAPRTAPSTSAVRTEAVEVEPDGPESRSPDSTDPPARPRPSFAPEPPPSGVAAFRQPVSIGGFRMPVWLLLAGGAAAFVFVAIAGTLVLSLTGSSSPSATSKESEAARSAVPLPAASAAPPTSPTDSPRGSEPEPPAGTVEAAAQGDAQALAAIEAKPATKRTLQEVLALGQGRTTAKRSELAKLGDALKKEPALLEQGEAARRLRVAADDRDVAAAALEIMATVEHASGPDLLYDVWIRTRGKTATTEVAEALVFVPSVRKRASPALATALDLRAAESCEETLAAVKKAVQHGDGRSLLLLGRLAGKTGCGDRKTEDCYPCLREGDAKNELRDAVKAVRGRPAPRF